MPEVPQVVLEVVDLACERDDRVLFEQLALTVVRGEAVQLRGANGAGKTTLLRCIAGLHVDHTGTVRILGETGAAARSQLLYAGHRPGLAAALTAAENLAWATAIGGSEADADAIAAALARVGLAHWDDVPCQQMSAGQQRRVALARLVLVPAALWLLDEPFTALDDDGIAMVVGLLREHLDGGGAALFATHQTAPGLDRPTTLRLEGGRAIAEEAA